MAVLKKLENKIKLVLIITSLFLTGCVVISLGSLFVARGMVADAHKKIYVLDGPVPILVKQTTMDETFEVEAKSHVEMFHNLFFTLAPDDKYIDYTIKKAMYLIDESGLAQYNALKEKGFYNNIIGTSTICSIFCDSIKLDKQKMTFTYYGRQRIERRTSILMRQLITAGSLRRVSRSENNPHGFIIFGWRTLVNKDLSENQKTNF
ncbi:conjugal transfer protein TraK [Prevotella sp. HMSC077E09]|uniref:conjugative transposon protein TraK n=1 Tax=Prevotella sp. HMSC077E09 TaxID=1739487 RepID=UPI0008A4ABE0|nr:MULTISPECIES: conjugative transposon protein TraK [unclassified Prevotella]OFO82868.1 conjugal transfer protein TraK [Prevotella sp. HMSC077E08]OFP48929.1 conjugal transfer protein TraK [Prevotella sp. HMSC077E09]